MPGYVENRRIHAKRTVIVFIMFFLKEIQIDVDFSRCKSTTMGKGESSAEMLNHVKDNTFFSRVFIRRRVRGKEGKSLKVKCEFIAFGLPIDLIFIPIDIPFQ